MKTFIYVIDERTGRSKYLKYYISNTEFGVNILARYIARFVLNKPLDECREFIMSRIYIGRSQERCYFDYHEKGKTYVANMTSIETSREDRIIMLLPDEHYLIVVDENGEEKDM